MNEVRWTYNDFFQSIQTYQSHSGVVNTSTTPSVQQTYADGSDNTVRPTSLIYPNGRTLAYNYGTAGGIDDSVSRISNYFSGVYLAFYRYLGLGTVVQQDSTQASLQYTLVSPTNTIDPDTGDIYAGLDRFGRVKDCRWRNTATGDDLSRVQYGYNRASSRTWRANPTDPDQHYDWLYGYDGLQRVTSGKRGTLNGTHTAITDAQFGQCWTLDSTGNWQGFRQDDTGSGTWSLVQTRTANPVNEITSINASIGQLWANPEYDSNGNMTRIPRPGLTPPSWGNLTKEQWSTLTKEEWADMEVAPTFRATYDAWNRLVTLTEGGTGQTVQQNQYDGRNYRVVREDYTDGTLTETRHFYYTNSWQDVEERPGTNPNSTNPDRQFVWGVRYIDDLICRECSVTGALDESLYGCQDANWNMTAVVDTTGAVQERYEYDPYGATTVLSNDFVAQDGSSVDWETTYAGYRREQDSGLFAVRNRVYQPQIGRWISRDPAGYKPGQNLYAYVRQRSLSRTDPLGKQDLPPLNPIPIPPSLTPSAEPLFPSTPPFLPTLNPIPTPLPEPLPVPPLNNDLQPINPPPLIPTMIPKLFRDPKPISVPRGPYFGLKGIPPEGPDSRMPKPLPSICEPNPTTAAELDPNFVGPRQRRQPKLMIKPPASSDSESGGEKKSEGTEDEYKKGKTIFSEAQRPFGDLVDHLGARSVFEIPSHAVGAPRVRCYFETGPGWSMKHELGTTSGAGVIIDK